MSGRLLGRVEQRKPHTTEGAASDMAKATATLALLGGPTAITTDTGDLFRWPTVTEEDEQAVLEVLRAGSCARLTCPARHPAG